MQHTALPSRLVVFHYHLRPGGVTTVIVDGLSALAAEWERIGGGGRLAATVVCGSSDNVESVKTRLAAAGIDIEMVVDPVFGYSEVEQSQDDVTAIAHRLSTRFADRDALWWVHNYHLGKNPAFSAALIDVLQMVPSQRAFLQIHDFPECARPQNLAALNSVLTVDPYPRQANLLYVVINERDRRLLMDAGIPQSQLFLLDNPVRTESLEPSAEPVDVRAALARLPSVTRCDHKKPWLVYPVRCIRRKNVLEAALLSAMVDANLVVTLPGTSEAEKPYSDMVESAFLDGTIEGVWSAGTRIDELGYSFRDLIGAADAIVSSSVQEGFGFQYVSAAAWGKPLFARYLDVLDGILPVFEGFPAQFYDRVLVPFETPTLSNYRPYLQMRYGETDAPGIDDLLSGHLIDFSYLSGNLQLAILKDLHDNGFKEHLRAINSDLITRLIEVIGASPAPLLSRIKERFGARAFADRFVGAVDALAGLERTNDTAPADARAEVADTATKACAPSRPVQDKLTTAFGTIEYRRLLYAAPERLSH